MRFLVDECAGPALARWLRSESHEVYSVYESSRGAADDEILDKAYNENRILVTSDKDFGEKVYREKRSHHGIILFRLLDERALVKIDAMKQLLANYEHKLADAFVVVSESQVRFGQ